MSLPADAPVQRVRYATTDVEEATETLRTQYSEHVPSFSGSPERFALDIDTIGITAPAGSLRIDGLRHTMCVHALVEPFPMPAVVITDAGLLRYSCQREETSGIMLTPTWAPVDIEWDDIAITIATLDPDGLRRVGAEVSGLPASAVAFSAMSPVSPEMGRFVGSTVRHLERHVLSNDEVMSSSLARGAAFHELAAAMLVAFPNTTHTVAPPRGGVRAEPATVRRAVEFIDANAHRDIGLTEIAEAARVGVRGLQMAFRRHRDTTPLAYLKRVRLEWAHRDLQLGDPLRGDTVAGIAARWGFTNASAFSVDYRRTYGRPPSHTLRG